MGISITITDVANLTAEEKALLATLTDGGQAAEKPAAAPKAKAEVAPKKKKVVEEEVVEAEVVEDDEDEDEDLVGGDEPTMADAVARATELVGEKRQQEVKDALAEFGVKRVSELKGGQIGAFLESLAD